MARLSVGDRPLLRRQCERQSARCLLAAESADPGKHQLCCNPEKRGVEFAADLAAAFMCCVRLCALASSGSHFFPAQLEITCRCTAHNRHSAPGDDWAVGWPISNAGGRGQTIAAIGSNVAKPRRSHGHACAARVVRPAGLRLPSVAISDERASGRRVEAVDYALRFVRRARKTLGQRPPQRIIGSST